MGMRSLALRLRRKSLRNLVWIVIFLYLVGCTPLVSSTQPQNTAYAILAPDTKLGQTFVAEHDGLSGIELSLSPEIPGEGDLILHLRSGPGEKHDLATAVLTLESVSSQGKYLFSFQPIENSRRQYYYAFIEMEGDGCIQVGMASGEAYLDGAIYRDHQPRDSQMSFSLMYNVWQVFGSNLVQAASWFGILVLGVFLYILPGWALLKCLWNGWDQFSTWEKAALAGGISLAIIPLLFLWTDLVGVHLGLIYAWLPGILAIFALFWMNRNHLSNMKAHWPSWTEVGGFLSAHSVDLLLAIVLTMVFFVRFWSVRNLDLPMWGDSYQHTMITQLMMDNGGLFDSWKPYASLDSLTYHYGFHADAALFGWLTHLPATRAVIWVGQILNGLAVLAVYPFAVRIGGNRWAGVGAVLLAGLLFPIPMSYVNWGRYTQLAGQTILPVLALLFLDAVREEKHDWSKIAILVIALGGLALSHYRVLVFALALIPAYLVLEARRKNLLAVIIRLTVMGIGAFGLFLPWFLHVYGARIMAILNSQLTTLASAISTGLEQYNSIGEIVAYLPGWAWLALFVVTVVGLLLRKRDVIFIAVWWLIVLLAANPALLGLPGTGILSNFAVFIAAYIPASTLLGAAVGWISNITSSHWPAVVKPMTVALTLIIVATALIGSKQRITDVRSTQFALATRPDLHAAAWIRDNTPEDAGFVVNYFFSYLDQLIVGSDGGWWLPLLTERQTNLPPLSYGIEDSSGDAYLEWTNELAREIKERGITNPDILNSLLEGGFEYIYIGQRQGTVNNPDPIVLDPEVLQANPHFQAVYQRDRVWIFKIIP